MNQAPSQRRGRPAARQDGRGDPPVYAVVDLGTNNCRLMIATFHNSQYRIVEAFSRIVRLGEGLSASGRLQDGAMERALKALRICAEKIERRGAVRIRAVATQACRQAKNGADFIARVARETGLRLTIISPEEEAHLSVLGCASLLDPREVTPSARAALVIDVGGGSTELSWVELDVPGDKSDMTKRLPRPRYWISLPVGVVTLAERFPEPDDDGRDAWFTAMVDHVAGRITAFPDPEPLRPHFERGEAYIVGTSGAITSLAGVHLGLERYDRSRVDGLWMERDHCRAVTARLIEIGRQGREQEPCIGRDRADLVLAGAAILEAVQRVWPCTRLRVADRGLREGLLLSMARRKNRRRRRRNPPRPAAAAAAE